MSYIGRGLQAGAFRQLDDISSGFDGSDATHTMQVNSVDVTVGDVNQILLSLGGVIQKPGTDFTVASSVITFTTAPAANTSFFAILLGSDNGGTVTPTDLSVSTGKIAADAITSAKIADDAVTGDHIASSGAFAIGATGTASTLAGIPFFSDTTNGSIYTHDVSGTDSTAEGNAAYGLLSLDAITTGDYNTAIGSSALTANTTGHSNVALGQAALLGNTEGFENVSIGKSSLLANTTGDYNIAIGVRANDLADTENHNLAIGYEAMTGAVAGGEYNVAVGNYTLDALTSADANVAVGYQAGSAVTTGIYNTLVGYQSGLATTEGAQNTFLGRVAGGANTTGGVNIAIGDAAYDAADTESNNLAIGVNALGGNVAGGEYNVAVGNLSLDAVTSGDSNTTLGYQAGTAVNSGSNNVMIGYQAGDDITTGSGVVNIGDNTDNGGNVNHSIVIGQAASGKGANTGFISPNGGAVYQGNNSTAWSQTSDIRIKKNIKDNNIGLEKINKIKVRNFEYKLPEEITEVPTHAAIKKEGVQLGVIAQEIQEVLPDTVVQTTHGVYSVNPDNITWYLVNAVQELSAKVKALEDA